MVDLGKKIQVEELLCTKEKTVSSAMDMSNKAHVSEHKSSNAERGEKNKHNSRPGSHKKGTFQKPKYGINKIKGPCYACGVDGHIEVHCRNRKKLINKRKNNANLVENNKNEFSGTVSEEIW